MQTKSLSRDEVWKLIFSGICGMVICIISSAIVNTTLVEISINIIFAFYFGICFMLIGGLITYQINGMSEKEHSRQKINLLMIFGTMVLVSGIFCLFLEENWFRRIHFVEKIPLYILISISLNFSLIFSLVDLLNFGFGFFQKSWQKAMVESQSQIYLVLLVSVILGSVYGLMFGIFDLEDQNGRQLDLKLIQEESYCLPVSALIGFFAGAINEIFRVKGDYLPLGSTKIDDPFNEEI